MKRGIPFLIIAFILGLFSAALFDKHMLEHISRFLAFSAGVCFVISILSVIFGTDMD